MNSRQIFAGLFGLGFSAAVAAAGPVYYVSNIGDDANNGRSPEQAWRTINKVNSSVNATGADVYLRAGDVWDDRVLTVDWSGTAEDPAIVGAYHFDGGQLRHDAGELRKPEINGTLESACRRAKNCAMQSSRAVPTSTYRGLIHLAARHVTIQNLRLRDSAGQMISFDTNNLPRHIVIEGNDMAYWSRGIIRSRGVTNMVIRNNVARRGNYCDKDDYAPCQGGFWAAGIYVADAKPGHVLMENNEVTESFGEGFSCVRSSNVVIRGNRAGNLRSALFYLDNCTNSVVEHNIGWSDPGGEWHWRGTGQEAITLASEDYRDRLAGDTVDNIVRNNMVAGTAGCIRIGMDPGSRELGRKVGAKIYGNTCMGTQGPAFTNNIPAANIDVLRVTNNIFHANNGSGGPCKSAGSSKLIMRSNLWNSAPGSACSGAGDVVGDPMVQGSGWASKSVDNPPVVSDFQLAPQSPAKGSGIRLSNMLGELGSLMVDSMVSWPCNAFDDSELALDFMCAQRPAQPNMGALEDEIAPPPKAPVVWF